jgi:hypothetical protein
MHIFLDLLFLLGLLYNRKIGYSNQYALTKLNDLSYVFSKQWHGQPDNLVPSCKFKIIIIGSFQKRSTLPPQRKFLPSGGKEEKKLFLITVSVLGFRTSERGRGVNFQFPPWGRYGCFLE